jgi:hypothetical protein
VARTDDLIAVYGATGEAAAVMGAHVLDSEEFARDVEDRDEYAIDFRGCVVAGRYRSGGSSPDPAHIMPV